MAIPVAWQQWLLRAPAARGLGRAMGMAAVCGLAVTIPVIVADLIRDRPTPYVNRLVPVAVVLIVFGSLWGATCTQLRRSTGVLMVKPAHPLLQTTLAKGLGTLVGVGFALVMFTSVRHGGPTTPVPGCPYRLDSHGAFTCVSPATYAHVGAGVQRFVCCVFSIFFAGILREVRYGLWSQRQTGGVQPRLRAQRRPAR